MNKKFITEVRRIVKEETELHDVLLKHYERKKREGEEYENEEGEQDILQNVDLSKPLFTSGEITDVKYLGDEKIKVEWEEEDYEALSGDRPKDSFGVERRIEDMSSNEIKEVLDYLYGNVSESLIREQKVKQMDTDRETSIRRRNREKIRRLNRRVSNLKERLSAVAEKANFLNDLNADMLDVFETFFDEVDDEIDIEKSKKEWLGLMGREGRIPYFKKTLRT